MYKDFQQIEKEAAQNGMFFINPMATPHSTEQVKKKHTEHINNIGS